MRTRKHLILMALLFLLVASLVFVGGGCGSTNSVPTTSTLSPASKTVGETDFTLTVNGTNFVNGSVVKWNGTDRTTTFVSATQLTAAISAADIAAAGTVPVTVFNPKPGGGTSTPALTLTINSPAPAPKATVYITRTGAKYHSDGCQYLRQSRIPISLSDAIAQGYSP